MNPKPFTVENRLNGHRSHFGSRYHIWSMRLARPFCCYEALLRSFDKQLARPSVAGGHTATNTPDLFRTPKLTVAGLGQYWGGGPPGKSFGCCRHFIRLAQDVLRSAPRLLICVSTPTSKQNRNSAKKDSEFEQLMVSTGGITLLHNSRRFVFLPSIRGLLSSTTCHSISH